MKKDFPITLIPRFCLMLEALNILEKDDINFMIRLHTYWVNYKEKE